MSNGMTIEAFANKVEWEGGLYEALFGYGLDSGDVEPGPLKEALEKIEELAPDFLEAMYVVEEMIEVYNEES